MQRHRALQIWLSRIDEAGGGAVEELCRFAEKHEISLHKTKRPEHVFGSCRV